MILLLSAAFALTLDEATAIARGSGTDAQIISAQAAASSTVRGQAASALLPRVSLSGGYTWNQYESAFDISAMLPEELAALVGETEPFVINKKEFWSGSATVVQPLFSGSALPGFQAANQLAKAAELAGEGNLDQVEYGAAAVYWSAVFARERVIVAEDAVKRAESYLALAETRERVGAGRALDTASAGAAVARARRELATAQAGQVEASEALTRWFGVSADVTLERPAASTVRVGSADEAVRRATESPALRAAEARAKASRLSRTATDLGWVPTVSGRFTEQFSQNSGFSGEQWNWQAAVTADWALFDGGYRIAKQNEAALNAKVANLAAERETDQLAADARSLYAKAEAAALGKAQAIEERALAERALTIGEQTYTLGAMTFIELWQIRQQRDGAVLAELGAEMQLDLAVRALHARIGV